MLYYLCIESSYFLFSWSHPFISFFSSSLKAWGAGGGDDLIFQKMGRVPQTLSWEEWVTAGAAEAS